MSWAVQKFKVRTFYLFYCYNFPARVSRVVSLFGYADAFCLEDIFVFLKAEEAFFFVRRSLIGRALLMLRQGQAWVQEIR